MKYLKVICVDRKYISCIAQKLKLGGGCKLTLYHLRELLLSKELSLGESVKVPAFETSYYQEGLTNLNDPHSILKSREQTIRNFACVL